MLQRMQRQRHLLWLPGYGSNGCQSLDFIRATASASFRCNFVRAIAAARASLRAEAQSQAGRLPALSVDRRIGVWTPHTMHWAGHLSPEPG